MKISWLFALPVLTGACASTNSLPTASVEAPPVIAVSTRDEIMGMNQARAQQNPKKSKEYIFRNIASAFPDTGKNMLLRDRVLPKSSVTGAVDRSPWHVKIYENPEHIQENQSRFSNDNKVLYKTPLTQKEAQVLSQAPKKVPEEPFYQTETFGRDDAFEPNNDIAHAFNLSLLGPKNVRTEGVQWDEDWYRITVSPQYRQLILDLRFQQYLGDIDMRLYDAKGNLIATSQGNGDDEYLNLILEKGGTYFVQIYGTNHGNRYDFKYSTYFTGGTDDEYEENDTLKTAFDLRKFEGQWLSEIRGEGVAADDDYYMIQVAPGKERVQIDFRYDISRGDIDLRLLNSQGKVVASSANVGSDEFIDFTVANPGVYYLKVYPFAPQGSYNMYDLKWSTQKPSRNEMSNSSPKKSKTDRQASQ